MSQHHEIIEADKVYLEEVGMRGILQQFVADAMESHPINVYEYMMTWAAARRGSAVSPKGAAQAGAEEEEYPVEEEAAHAQATPAADKQASPHSPPSQHHTPSDAQAAKRHSTVAHDAPEANQEEEEL
ncbi:hypothetical protein NESM_000352900 [Novymonas esmeraldas]|uniref:Uncharacterized protein n=1 Tax=Novymonas esmeraldas TaxID=1808958 RepID=A0AAW0EKU0_9TRYP